VNSTIELFTIEDNEIFCHQLVLLRGRVVCSNLQSSYPNDIDPSNGRFINVRGNDNVSTSWPINSFHEFKALIRLKKGSNKVLLDYNYNPKQNVNEKGNLEINLVYTENMKMEALNLGIFHAKDSKLTFDIDKESKSRGQKNDLQSAIKRLGIAAMLMQALTSDSLCSHGLERKSFRLDLDSNFGW
jgi:hypothetical protein